MYQWPPIARGTGKKHGLHPGAPHPSALPSDVIHTTSTIPMSYRQYTIWESIDVKTREKLKAFQKTLKGETH